MLENSTVMSTGLIVNTILIALMAVGLVVGFVARGEHKRNASRQSRRHIKN